MAINEKIVTGRKYRRLIDKDSKLWQLISWWTKASDVEFDDGKTAEEKVGNINGITSDIDDDSEDIAASSALTHETHARINELTDNGKIVSINIDESGNPYIKYKDGADTVSKKLGSGTVMYLGNATSFNVNEVYDDYRNLTSDNFIIEVPSFKVNSSPAVQIKEQDLNLFAGGIFNLSKEYDPSIGKLKAKATLTATAGFSESGTTKTQAKASNFSTVNAYLVVMPGQDDPKDDITKVDDNIKYPH